VVSLDTGCVGEEIVFPWEDPCWWKQFIYDGEYFACDKDDQLLKEGGHGWITPSH